MDELLELTQKAEQIARMAIGSQLDKAGKLLLSHSERVAAYSQPGLPRIVAWLHDVIEDSGWTIADLQAEGFPEEVCQAVNAITHPPGEPNLQYYTRIKANPLALEVKAADLKDNTNPERRALLANPAEAARLDQKYRQACAVLEIPWPWPELGIE